MAKDEKMERLEAARTRVDELARTKERLGGVLETKRARVEELEKKARDEFDCEVADIPDLVEKLDREGTEALEKVEKMLNQPTKFNPCINEDGTRDERTTSQMKAAIAAGAAEEDDDEDALP